MLKMMKYLLHTLSCLLLFAAGTCLAQTPGHTLRSGGIDRTYRLHLPEGLPDGAPLVIVLHGYGGQGDPERFDMNRVPTATVSPSATRRANATAAAKHAGTWVTPFRPIWPSTTCGSSPN